ncbi:GNAT family N-acetyltransferase [Halomonas sp. SpR8]|uniref:GNAT family N-acetyltransferase n=1 Tax=Halomonas sp. SpR8 TaxID=3050463 RepID=UPI0027E56802|nr:GNAT family N-acetyltransferase [Halomonas sp. SpR8]MDQ7730745.1 GNAT family N-acetyltransferase [Halomonas sp. SpR8]
MAQLGYDHSEESLSANISAVREQGGEVFVAEVAGSVRGCVSAIIDVHLAEGVKGEIVSLVVSEAARGQGLGKGLVLEAEKWLSGKVSAIRLR